MYGVTMATRRAPRASRASTSAPALEMTGAGASFSSVTARRRACDSQW